MSSVAACDECGFEYSSVDRSSVVARLRSFGPRFAASRDGPAELVHQRPEPEVWSSLEYACHVRDTFLSHRERLYLMLAEDVPAFRPMYRDLRVNLAHYNDEPVPQVIAELTFSAQPIADAFAGLDEEHWWRTCVYNYPVSAERTVLWLGQHTVHEGEHHLMDVTRGLHELSLRRR
jgi:hypothetical protein